MGSAARAASQSARARPTVHGLDAAQHVAAWHVSLAGGTNTGRLAAWLTRTSWAARVREARPRTNGWRGFLSVVGPVNS
jgi:hypothetical protein